MRSRRARAGSRAPTPCSTAPTDTWRGRQKQGTGRASPPGPRSCRARRLFGAARSAASNRSRRGGDGGGGDDDAPAAAPTVLRRSSSRVASTTTGSDGDDGGDGGGDDPCPTGPGSALAHRLRLV